MHAIPGSPMGRPLVALCSLLVAGSMRAIPGSLQADAAQNRLYLCLIHVCFAQIRKQLRLPERVAILAEVEAFLVEKVDHRLVATVSLFQRRDALEDLFL